MIIILTNIINFLLVEIRNFTQFLIEKISNLLIINDKTPANGFSILSAIFRPLFQINFRPREFIFHQIDEISFDFPQKKFL